LKTEYVTSEAERRYRKAYYERNKERILQRRREKYHADPDKYRDENKQYRLTHDRSEYFRQYYRRKKVGE
jgi:hypothetical protein